MMRENFSTREIGDLLDVEAWRVRRLFEAGALPEPERFAGKRVIPRRMIPTILDALRARGWLPGAEAPPGLSGSARGVSSQGEPCRK